MSRILEFWVTVCLGRGDGGDVAVDVKVTNEEYKLLIECCQKDEEIEGYGGLEKLYARIIKAARIESGRSRSRCDDAIYMIAMPDQVYEDANVE